MPAWPLVRFVDKVPNPSAGTTLLEVNGSAATTTQVDDQGFSLGQPTFEGNPESVGVEDGYRQIRMVVSVVGTYATAAAALQNIARVLARPMGAVLMYQHGTSDDATYFKVWRSQLPELDTENVSTASSSKWDLPITMWADPYGYGPQETVGPVTITNNPATGTNPAWYEFGTIKGDVAAPLRVEIDPSVSWSDMSPLMATAALDASENPSGPVFWQTNSFSVGIDATHDAAAGATYSGGNRTTVSFATQTDEASRVLGAAPTAPDPGLYKILLRVARSDSSSTFSLKIGQTVNSISHYPQPAVAYGPPSTTPAMAWVDMGEFMFPFGASGLELADASLTYAEPEISVRAARLTGTGTLSLDALLLIPVRTSVTQSAKVMVANYHSHPSTAVDHFDGNRQQFSSLVSSEVVATERPVLVGGWPEVVPGCVNIFHLVHQTNGLSGGDSVTATASVTFRYYPRYLHLRPNAD